MPWLVCVLVLIGLVSALVAAGSGGGSETASAQVPSAEAPVDRGAESGGPALGRELAHLRTARSRTFEAADGSYVAKVYPGPVNYRDSNGRWQWIENELVRRGGELANRANRFALALPDALDDGGVRVTEDGEWIDFRLRGATGTAAVSGRRAR